jgi:hypothetical protein
MQRLLILLALIVFSSSLGLFLARSRNQLTPSTGTFDGTPVVIINTPEPPEEPISQEPTSSTIPPSSTPTEQKLMEIAMEYLLLPDHTPDETAKLSPIKPGNKVYALVNCGTDGVAIRYDKKYLTVVTPSLVRWERQKLSCFRVTSSFCGSENYVMLRHVDTGNFLRAAMTEDDEPLYSLVCKDAPTTVNFRLFCWKLSGVERKNVYADSDCGCKFDPVSGTEVCKNCDTKPGQFPEVVGFEVNKARDWILSQDPSLQVIPVSCPQQSSVCPPVQMQPGVVVLYFDPVNNRVNRIPYVQ